MWHWQTPAIPVVAALLAVFLPAPADATMQTHDAYAAAVSVVAETA
jgi:hypothetical protein